MVFTDSLPGVLANRVKKALDHLRLPEGEWSKYEVPTPHGGPPERIFISKDRNSHQLKKERDIKKAFDAWKETFPNHTVFINKENG